MQKTIQDRKINYIYDIQNDIKNISLVIILHFFNFMERKPSAEFMVFLAIFHELTKLQNFE